MKKFTFEDYCEAMEGAGPKVKEIILEHAAQYGNLELTDFVRLCKLSDPDPV